MQTGSIFTRRFQLWLLVGLVLVGVSFFWDDAVCRILDVTDLPVWKKIAWWCSKIGEGWVIAIWGIAVAFIWLLGRQPRFAAAVFHTALASLLIGLAATILRVLFGRTRPLNHDVPQGFYGVWHDGHWIIGKFKYSSFPSGHTATAVGLVAAVWLINRRWGLVALPYALAVTWSRIALQCHHLSDVLGSAVLAIAGAVIFEAKLRPWLTRQFERLYRAKFSR